MVSLADVRRGQWGQHLSGQIRDAIRSGSLRPGVKLPASRTLAGDLGLSRGVVSGVYDQLKAEGYLTTRRGSGTEVADSIAPAPRETRQPPTTRPTINPGLPDPNLFPRQEWLRAYRRAVERLPDSDLNYPDPRGYAPLQSQLADYLGRVRGIRADPNQILVVNGFAQGLAILARVLPSLGIQAVAVEEPGSTGTRNQLNDWGIATPPATVDDDGLNVDALRGAGAQAVLLTPAHHYPTGVVLTPDRRRQLLHWVREEPGRYLIEDDYDAEYRYDSAPIGSLQPLDPQRVITGSSVSKTLAPSLRIGWLVLPPSLVARATTAKAAFDLGTSVLTQAALAELLATGAIDRHLRRSRRVYRSRRQVVARHLTAELPQTRITGLDAGLNICVDLDSRADDENLAEGLRATGIRCEALSHYQQRPNPNPGIVIDITTVADHHLAGITAAIRSTW